MSKNSLILDLMTWGLVFFCLYQAFIGISTKVVLGFGGRGSGIVVNVPYNEHPIAYFLYLSFYLFIGVKGFFAFLRWLRGEE